MPLINTVKSEYKRLIDYSNAQPNVAKKVDKKLSSAALERFTYWVKKIITYLHFPHPAFPNQPVPPNALPSDKVKKAFQKIHPLSDEDTLLAWKIMSTILKNLVDNYAPKRRDSNIMTRSNVDDAVVSTLNNLSALVGDNILMKMSMQRSPSDKRSGRSSKKSRRCSSGKHYRRSYRSSSGKRIRGKCVKNSRSRSRRYRR
jgi:hypothetical protein